MRRQAIRDYRREFLHAMRNGKSTAASAEIATTKAKELYFKDPRTIALLEEERQIMWEEILDILVEVSMILSDIGPLLDKDKIPPKDQIDLKLATAALQEPVDTESTKTKR